MCGGEEGENRRWIFFCGEVKNNNKVDKEMGYFVLLLCFGYFLIMLEIKYIFLKRFFIGLSFI